MASEGDVRAASEQFYAALNSMLNGDAGPMKDIWSHSGAVTTMHPIGGRETGWDAVRNSWEQVAGIASGGQVRLGDQNIQAGEDMAYEIGIEHARFSLAGQSVTGEARVTNVYRRETSGWKIVHHHTDSVPEMIGVLTRLKQKG